MHMVVALVMRSKFFVIAIFRQMGIGGLRGRMLEYHRAWLFNTDKSFIAGIYSLVRKAFRVGDRIHIGSCYAHWRRNRRWDISYDSMGFGAHMFRAIIPAAALIKFPNEKVSTRFL